MGAIRRRGITRDQDIGEHGWRRQSNQSVSSIPSGWWPLGDNAAESLVGHHLLGSHPYLRKSMHCIWSSLGIAQIKAINGRISFLKDLSSETRACNGWISFRAADLFLFFFLQISMRPAYLGRQLHVSLSRLPRGRSHQHVLVSRCMSHVPSPTRGGIYSH